MKYFIKGIGPEYCVFAMSEGAVEVLCFNELTPTPILKQTFALFHTGAPCNEITAEEYRRYLIDWAVMRISTTPALIDYALSCMNTIGTSAGTYLTDGLARMDVQRGASEAKQHALRGDNNVGQVDEL